MWDVGPVKKFPFLFLCFDLEYARHPTLGLRRLPFKSKQTSVLTVCEELL